MQVCRDVVPTFESAGQREEKKKIKREKRNREEVREEQRDDKEGLKRD